MSVLFFKDSLIFYNTYMEYAYLHSIETFGTVDGPGIRFVIFLSGCNLRCKYCHNPDTWNKKNGKLVSSEELFLKIMKYKHYYKNGGVTISGGEPLLQISFIIELFSFLKNENIHTAIDTAGEPFLKDINCSLINLKSLLELTDLFLIDIKHIDSSKHKDLTGKNNENILEFIKFIDENNKDIWLRYVLLPGINNDFTTLMDTKNFIKNLNNVSKIEILPYHKLGIKKYIGLGINYLLNDLKEPSQEEIDEAKRILNKEDNEYV